MEKENDAKMSLNEEMKPSDQQMNNSDWLKMKSNNMLLALQDTINQPTTNTRVAYLSFILSLASFSIWTERLRIDDYLLLIITLILIAFELTVELYFSLVDEKASLNAAWFYYKCFENILTTYMIFSAPGGFEPLYFAIKILILVVNTFLTLWVLERKHVRVVLKQMLEQKMEMQKKQEQDALPQVHVV